MRARLAMGLAAALLAGAPASAQTVIVQDNFDSYADSMAFQAAWAPTIGNGSQPANPADVSAGLLTSDPLVTFAYPNLQGQAVDHIGATASSPGMVNQWGGVINQGNGQNPAFSVAPSATQNLVLRFDMFDGASGNERMSVGLRYISVSGTTVTTQNILELGLYNSNSADPTNPGDWSAISNAAQNATAATPGFYTGRGYGVRATIFQSFSAPFAHPADWQYFRTEGETENWGGQALGDMGFDIGLERTTDTGDVVTVGDIGQGWHRYTATISTNSVTIELDLFRDGLRNTSKDPVTPGGDDRPGIPGLPDAKMTLPITLTANGFNSLRMGGPSGLLSAGPGVTAFDNVLLQLVDIAPPPTDDANFNGDSFVNKADLNIWANGFPTASGAGATNGDANGDGSVDGRDFLIWQRQVNAAGGAVAAIPEPASAAIAVVGLAMLGTRRRAR